MEKPSIHNQTETIKTTVNNLNVHKFTLMVNYFVVPQQYIFTIVASE